MIEASSLCCCGEHVPVRDQVDVRNWENREASSSSSSLECCGEEECLTSRVKVLVE